MKLPFSYKSDWNIKLLLQSKRIVYALYILMLFPLLLLTFSIREKTKRIKDLTEEVSHMGLRIQRTLEVQKDKNAFFKKYRGADRYFLDHVLELSLIHI